MSLSQVINTAWVLFVYDTDPNKYYKGMFVIKWETDDGKKAFNTYLYGSPAFSLEKYKEWLEKINKMAF